jgi:hypothetical protein
VSKGDARYCELNTPFLAIASSRRDWRDLSMSRHTRAMTVGHISSDRSVIVTTGDSSRVDLNDFAAPARR